MSDALVKWLRSVFYADSDLLEEAADRIEELEAKLARVIGAADAMADAIQYQVDIYDASMDAEAALKGYRATPATLKGDDE
jgi:vacuolar-type H+-ATPase subunit I/STV1